MREELGRPLDAAVMPSLALLLGSSDFLARQLIENPHWADDLAGDPPAAPEKDQPRLNSGWADIREAKYRGLLRVASRELLGCPLQESFVELSELASRCLARALERAAQEAGIPVPPTLALGSLGRREISITPSVELLFLTPERAGSSWRHGFERLMQVLLSGLERGDGVLYRLSAWLLPAGVPRAQRLAPLALPPLWGAFDVAARDALLAPSRLLSARRLLGAGDPAEAFVRGIWPGLQADFGVTSAQLSRVAQPRTGEGLERDLRWGAGGIRQLEVFVHQLVVTHGASDARLRTGNILEALTRLGLYGYLDEVSARSASDAYGWLRRAEHFLQLADEQPVCDFPERAPEQIALARRMGYREVDARGARRRLLHDWTAVRDQVEEEVRRPPGKPGREAMARRDGVGRAQFHAAADRSRR